MSDGRPVAVIPARGGSKRIPHKNIRPFLGVPLLARTIAMLRETALFSRIVVSTDDSAIMAVARDAGAEVPFVRQAALADDVAATVPVIRDAVQRLAAAGDAADIFVAVYPAAVFTRADDIRRAIAMLRDQTAADAEPTDYVVPVTTFAFPIQRALRWREDGRAEMFHPEHLLTRSQDLPAAVHDAGQFYVGTRDAWLAERALFTLRTRLLPLPRHRVQDIDTEEDWVRAELLYRLLAADV